MPFSHFKKREGGIRRKGDGEKGREEWGEKRVVGERKTRKRGRNKETFFQLVIVNKHLGQILLHFFISTRVELLYNQSKIKVFYLWTNQ